MRSRLAGKNVLTLKQFALRTEVLTLFKCLLRTVKGTIFIFITSYTSLIPILNIVMEPDDRAFASDWIRQDFKRHINESDEMKIRMLLSQGRAELRKLETNLMLTNKLHP
ncbi:hypothetical protein SmJEL517_g05184 [Synchytrium microbalum]|uniref:Complex 1 LYR protein domain-containing protein n=1 Tax=Synchytrium microbalum TaxID=1806994 RepID=A0A507BMQ4_9FUNG|nr:uncharacterized protein SmJEL517_g05184 [Synchytrium microbalum]TPX31480.1 hypothetical protein SmJEL517_g05184 [Synchytrium microbalum]